MCRLRSSWPFLEISQILLPSSHNKLNSQRMASWYGKTTSRELDLLLDRKPKMSELLLYPDFASQLKTYNPKLLDYFSSKPSLIEQLVCLIAVPPTPHDSDQRKYKLPLLAVELIEMDFACISGGLFKQNPEKGQTYYLGLYGLLGGQEVLPILAGYLNRVNASLMTSRQKEVLEAVYANPQIFTKMVEHSYHMSIAGTLQRFLNLDVAKNPSTPDTDPKLKVKLAALQQILTKIDMESNIKAQKSTLCVENLTSILCETVERYYLLVHGKQMLQLLTNQKTITLFMSMIKSAYILDNCFASFSFLISLINHYSFSSYNSEDIATEQGRKNMERLQSTALVSEISAFYPLALERVMKAEKLGLYQYRLLEVLCHSISISSMKIFECIRRVNFFGNLIKLMFQHEKQNILHVLIEKSFIHIFVSDRKIYQNYRRNIFCEVDIIDTTVGTLMRQFPIEKVFEQARKKAYFGHFMRILKIYSGIQTQDQAIIQAIRSKSEPWNKISKHLIIPYEAIYEKKLGSYEQVPQPIEQQFTVDKNIKIKTNPMKNSTIEQINKQENIPRVPMKSEAEIDNFTKLQAMEEKKAEEIFYRTPIQGLLSNTEIIRNDSSSSTTTTSVGKKQPEKSEENSAVAKPLDALIASNSNSQQIGYEKQLKKSQSFKQFMNKKKVQAEQEIKIRRSMSQQRKLSGGKSRITSPSPSKKNNWVEQPTEAPPRQSQPGLKPTPLPKIPLSRRPSQQPPNSQRHAPTNLPISPPTVSSFSVSSVNESLSPSTIKQQALEQIKMSNSVPFDIKRFKIIQIDRPAQRKFRKIDNRDRGLFQFLGININ